MPAKLPIRKPCVALFIKAYICLNDIQDPLLATIKVTDLKYKEVQEHLRHLDVMYLVRLGHHRGAENCSDNQQGGRRGPWYT
jgi:hypothetical protein